MGWVPYKLWRMTDVEEEVYFSRRCFRTTSPTFFFLKWLFCQTLWLIHLIASIWKAEAREPPVWGQTVLHMRWFLKTKQTSKIYQTNKNQCPPKKQQIILEMIESLLIFPYTPPIYSTYQSKINKQKLSKPILNELEAHGSHISYQSWN